MVKIDGGNGNALPAIIAAGVVDDLGLKEEDVVTAIIKTTNIMIGKWGDML